MAAGNDSSFHYSVGCPIYNYGRKKYLLTAFSTYWLPGEARKFDNWASGLPRYHIFSSDHPWGPWVEISSFSLWGSSVAEYLMCNKYTSADGKKMWICTSGSLPFWAGWNVHAPWHYGFQYMPVYLSTGEVVKYEAENGRVAIRNIRRDANAEIKDALKEKLVSEDEAHSAEDKIQKLTDQYVKEVEKLLEAKEADLLSI